MYHGAESQYLPQESLCTTVLRVSIYHRSHYVPRCCESVFTTGVIMYHGAESQYLPQESLCTTVLRVSIYHRSHYVPRC